MMEKCHVRYTRVLAAAVLLCALTACDDSSPIAPTQPPGPPTTVTFSGELTRSGAASYDFTPLFGGAVTATITELDGDEELVVGLALGNWFGGACSLVLANDNARGGAVLTGTLTQGGPLCVRIYDVGSVSEGARIPYTIEVVHP